jgi:hypothetical protein
MIHPWKYTKYCIQVKDTEQPSFSSLNNQTVSSKRLDEIDRLQSSHVMPEGLAASVLLSHGSQLHPGIASTRSHLA